jgi:hypothetical protein
VGDLLRFPERKSSEPELEPLNEFLARTRAMASATHKPAISGVLPRKWSLSAHHPRVHHKGGE